MELGTLKLFPLRNAKTKSNMAMAAGYKLAPSPAYERIASPSATLSRGVRDAGRTANPAAGPRVVMNNFPMYPRYIMVTGTLRTSPLSDSHGR
jgi:hypothetical protein